MSRYIDADKLKEALKQNLPQYMWGEMFVTVNIQPYIDIVRCKDCKYATKRLNDDYLCTHHGKDWNYYDHFCSYGERRSDD